MALVFDIETVGAQFDGLDEVTKHQLTRWIKREAGEDAGKYNVLETDLREGLGFSPLTGEIVALGVYDTDKDKGVVYYQAPDTHEEERTEGNFSFKPRTEAQMITDFWTGAARYDSFVSFNGRAFDVPFILIRGARHRLKPSVNLMADRYLRQYRQRITHVDLFDQLSFHGAVRRKGNLHLFCQALGIRSPKAGGITGDDVRDLFLNKQYREIADYNSWDLVATAELYRVWMEFIKI